MLFLIVLGAACSSGNGDPRPPELMLGSDVCEACGMVVSEARYAAATIIKSGHTHKFDDLAEMFIFQANHPEDVVRAWFVHDYASEAWIRGETAFYVMSAEIRSPMGYGVVAFETREAAETYAADLSEAEIYSFDELNAQIMARGQ
ncbi:MAG: hypothetical protein Fur0022_33020 [Anaerolineales bacterium]